MRKICLALLASATLAMPSFAQVTQESVSEVLPDPTLFLPTSPDGTAATSGTLYLHFKYGVAPTSTGTWVSGARISALYLTVLTGCITNVEISHRPVDQYAWVTASFPASQMMTFPFAGGLVEGPWSSVATFYTVCAYGLPSYDVTVPWTVPAPAPRPPPNAVVQGFKLDGNGNRFGNATIFVDGNSTGSSNPYGASMSPDTWHTFSSSVPAGYSVAYSACRGCIDHPDSSWVFGSSYVGQASPGSYLDLWWKYYAPPNSYLDTKQSYDGNFGGWAYDPSSSATSIAVHVYVDGPAGSGAPVYGITADVSRPDVDAAFNISGNHGFNFTLPSQYLQDGRNHTIYAYAIALFHQPNPLIGTGTYYAPCKPASCTNRCGSIPDGCGGTINCGSCALGWCMAGNYCGCPSGTHWCDPGCYKLCP